MLRHGVAQTVANHSITVVYSVGNEIAIDSRKGAWTIEVISVDHCKGTCHHPLTTSHSMTGAPGLYTPHRHLEARRQAVEVLKDIEDLKALLCMAADPLPELRFQLPLDYKGHLAKAGAPSVVQGEGEDGMTGPVYRCYLLKPSEAAAHPGSHNHQCGFCHRCLHGMFVISIIHLFPKIAIPKTMHFIKNGG